MVYLDANVVIRLIEGVPPVRAPLVARLASLRGVPRSLLTSRLTRLECRMLPLRNTDAALLAVYDAFFATPEVDVLEADSPVIEKTTDLRPSLRLKTLDSLHMATAVLAGASASLTGDKALARCTEVPVEVL